MDVLVVGASGLLGSNVALAALNRELSIGGTYHSDSPEFDIPLREFDICDTEVFHDILDAFDPSVVVNCAAMTDVDACERYPERAHEINATAPEDLARLCSERNVGFVHISTDYIFDGASEQRYHEESEANPIQMYGQSKLAGERGVSSVHEAPLIVRPSFIYGINRSSESTQVEGLPAWIHSRLASGEEIPLFVDQYVTPSRAGSTAEAILDLIFDGANGLYHVAARSCITPYEFGCILANTLDIDGGQLVESFQADVDRDAPRPSNTCLSVEKIETRLERSQPTVQQDVSALSPHL